MKTEKTQKPNLQQLTSTHQEIDLISNSKKPTVLLVEDDDIAGSTIAMMVETLHCSVIRVENGLDALSIVGSMKIDLVITDLCLPVMSGTEIIEHIRKINKTVPIFIVTGYLHTATETEMISVSDKKSCGVIEILMKPIRMKNLLDKIKEHTLIENAPKAALMKI
ncbi:MAG TPA: response regulator [bacterium]|nr:response regulator [bacterium]HNB08460.1 response regulator [bacterium]HNB55499.1 response regulator [bacterium]HNE82718.1 response regulator [bacterium]HNH32735.1 response regulator [bacterium]